MKLFSTGIISFLMSCCMQLSAQSNLDKLITINARSRKVESVLQEISRQAGFYFSYDSRIFKKDSLVSITFSAKPVKEIIEKLFAGRIDYKENGNYIILRRKAAAMPPQVNVVSTYIIKGFVKDARSNTGLGLVSVYDKTVLASALTNSDGSFVLKIKTKSKRPILSISKENYFDTSLVVTLPALQDIIINIQSFAAPIVDTQTITIISPTDTLPIIIPDTTIAFTKTAAAANDTLPSVEKTKLGNFLITTTLKIQSLNLSKFYTTRAYQLSFTPGLSTHGKLSSQVENYFSINVLGGYTGGTKFFEAGGLFNINRRNAQYIQAAGLLNIVGGNFTGLQAAGLHNHVLGNVQGLQAAGLSNYVNGSSVSLQVAGIFNHVKDSMKGVQASGIINYVNKKITGVQVAGIANIATQKINGVQVSGVFNYAKKLNGLQIGLINFSDSSNGFSIGLINIVKHGLHQLSFSTNEITNTNINIKTGNRKLYSIVHAGYNLSQNKKVFSYGYGVGTSLKLNRRLNFQPELLARYLYLGNWKKSNILSSCHLNFQWQAAKNFAIFAAPVFNLYTSNQTVGVTNYRFPVRPTGFPSKTFNDKVSGWIGFSAGISLF